LASYYTDKNEYDSAKTHLNKAKDNYKDYELEDRFQTQIRSLQRRIKLLHDEPKEALAREKVAQEERLQSELKEKNFYM